MTPPSAWKFLAATAATLAAIVALSLLPYGGNVSALLKIDESWGRQYDLPPGLVLYADGGYDGMLYYQVARDLPAFARGEAPRPLRGEIRTDRAYRWQRILLPLLAAAAAAGNASALPWSFLAVNFVAILAAAWIFARSSGRTDVHALVVAINPATLTGLQYTLTEPLALMFLVAFLARWKAEGERVTWSQVAMLTLSILAREVGLLVVAALGLHLLMGKRWREAAMLLGAVIPFAAWQLLLRDRFGDLALTANPVIGLPFGGCADLLAGLPASGAAGLSSLAFLAMFAAPLLVLTLVETRRLLAKHEVPDFPLLGLLTTMALLFCLSNEVWQAITAVGRSLPALYPFFALVAMEKDSRPWRLLSGALVALSLVAAVGVALSSHPHVVSGAAS